MADRWVSFRGRWAGGELDRRIAATVAAQGVEQHDEYPGRIRRRVGNGFAEMSVRTATPGINGPTWEIYRVETGAGGSERVGAKIGEIAGRHDVAVLAAAHYLTGAAS